MLRRVSVSSAKVSLALFALLVLSAQGKRQRVWAAADIPPSQSLFNFTHSKPGGRMILAADPQAATKKAFVEFLQKRDPDIAALNTKTGKSFQNWDAVLANRENISLDKLQPESEMFYERYCDLYFQTCRAALREYAPGRLYLGARFNVSNQSPSARRRVAVTF